MGKQSAFMARLQAAQEIRERQVRFHARVFQMDLVTLALGRMGFREKKFDELDKVLAEVAEEYCKEIIADSKADQDLWYSKDTIDRELMQYVGKRFIPYDERYKM